MDVQIHWKVYFEKSIAKYFQGFFPENNIYLCQFAKKAEDNGNNISQFISVSIVKDIIDPEKAVETLTDRGIYELVPRMVTRQNEIDEFFKMYSELRPPTEPNWQDTDDDGFDDHHPSRDFLYDLP